MKIIDLLNMAANDKADVYKTYFMFGDEKYNLYRFFDSYVLDFTSLNFEIEIIEEEKVQEKKIPEKLNFKHKEFEDDVVKLEYKNQTLNLGNVVLEISDTIDEIIDYLKSKEGDSNDNK